MCSSLTERVHVTLWSHGNAIPVHCSYHGVSSSLQQQTDQFKISCKARNAFLLLLKSSICSPKPQTPAEELLQWEEEKSPYQQLLPAVKEFQSNFPLHALRNLLPLLQHPAIARKKIHHLEQLGVSHSSEFMNSDKWEYNASCYLQTQYNGDTWHANSTHSFTEANSFPFFAHFTLPNTRSTSVQLQSQKSVTQCFWMGNGIRSVLKSNALEMEES